MKPPAAVYWAPPHPHFELKPNPSDSLNDLAWAFEYCFGKFPLLLNDEDIPYLKGMVAAGLTSVEELIKQIEKHHSIELTKQL